MMLAPPRTSSVRYRYYSDTNHGGNPSQKYFIPCKDKNETGVWLKNVLAMHVNARRAIAKALISDGVARGHDQVVVKVGESATLKKEYDIAMVLRDIPGFIKFVCAMTCNDSLRRYSTNSQTDFVCSGDTKDPEMTVLVMPFMSMGSMRHYDWLGHGGNVSTFRNCLKQVLCSLYFAFVNHGFLHSDTHLDNVLLKPTKQRVFTYKDASSNKEFRLQLEGGLKVVIMDFEMSFLGVNRSNTCAFFRDIQHIFYDIKYTLKLAFDGQQAIDSMLHNWTYDTAVTPEVMWQLFPVIDQISDIRSTRIIVARYDPNVF